MLFAASTLIPSKTVRHSRGQ